MNTFNNAAGFAHRFMALALSLMLAISGMFVLMPADEVYAADGNYALSDDSTILYEYTGSDEVVTIPDGVTTIGTCAFYGNSNIKKIVMPDSVTTIENQAFRFCDQATEIVWSKNLKTIDFSAFEGMRSMKSIVLPDSIESIDDYNFSSCDKLEYIKLPNKLTSLSNEVLTYDSLLMAVQVPDSVTSISDSCFRKCSDSFTVIGGAGSAAETFARNKGYAFATAGTDVAYTSQCDQAGSLAVYLNSTKLGSSASLKVGDLLSITATTTAADLNVTMNGKSLNYNNYQETKSELHDRLYTVTGPMDLRLVSVPKYDSLDKTLNVSGGNLHFTGDGTECLVDRGRSCATCDGYIQTQFDAAKTSYLLFDMKISDAYRDDQKVALTIDGNEYVFSDDEGGPDYILKAYELAPGSHTVKWTSRYSHSRYGDVCFAISDVRVVDDIAEVKASGFEITYPQIDLDIGESLTVEYDLKPEILSGKSNVKWTSDNVGVATVDNGIVTGVAKGKTTVTGTIDGVSSTVNVYVSGKTYGNDPGSDDPQYDEASLITGKKYLSETDADVYAKRNEVHVKGDKYAYLYSGRDLYRMDITGGAEAEKVLSCSEYIRCARARGRMIYLFSGKYAATSFMMTGYDTTSGQKVYEQQFDFTATPDYFAVDDYENFYFVLNDVDLYSYDKNGNIISSDVHSTDKLITGLGMIIPGDVDPFNYSVLATFANTMGRAVVDMETSTFSSIGEAISGLYTQSQYCGMRKIRNGEIIGSENYVKNATDGKGMAWTMLDRDNYAVNSRGMIVKFRKDRKSPTGTNYDVIKWLSGFSMDLKGPAAVYCGGDIYACNKDGIIFRVDPAAAKIKGTYTPDADSIYNLYTANGKVYFSASDDGGCFVAPLNESMYKPAEAVVRRTHITLTYGNDEVWNNYEASKASADYSQSSNLYASAPSYKAPYKAGALTEQAKQDVLKRLNYARWQYGINPLTINEQYMDRSQKGAVVMAATDELTHYPSQPSDMDDEFFKEAEAGVGADYDYSGNCSAGESVYDAVLGYLDDSYNVTSGSIGHRLSMLDTKAVSTSFGQAGRYSCMSIYTSQDNTPENSEEFYAWPSAGYFPSEMISTKAYWHIKTGWYFRGELKVTLTYDGNTYEAEDVGVDSDYNDTFKFRLPADLRKLAAKGYYYKDGAEITVSMSGLEDKMGNPIIVEYPVRFINRNETDEPVDPWDPDDPWNPDDPWGWDDELEAGTEVSVNGSTYTVVDGWEQTVALTKAKNKKSFTVPSTITIDDYGVFDVVQVNAKAFTGKSIRTVTIGKNVRKISKYAFKSSKATKMIVKTKLLSKARVKGSLKGSKIKTVQVKVSTKKSTNKKYLKKYKKYFTKANAGKKVKVK